MKRTTIIKNRWKRLTDKLYTRSDLHALLEQMQTTPIDDFDEVSEQIWIEAETINTPSIVEVINNERVALQLLQHESEKKQKKRFLLIGRWGSIAATLLLCISFYYVYHLYTEKQASTLLCEINVPYGKIYNEVLPDGTKVTLNAGSCLKYPKRFGSDIRYIEFKGEGFFDVTENKEHPFIINTEGYNVKVMGTSFNLRNYEDSQLLSLTLCTGKVQMSFEDEQISLRPGEQLMINKHNNDLERSKVITHNYTLWMKGKLYFNKTPIDEVVMMLERHYDCRIKWDSQNVFTNKVSGTHDNKSLEAVLHSIELATGIKYKKESECYVVYGEK